MKTLFKGMIVITLSLIGTLNTVNAADCPAPYVISEREYTIFQRGVGGNVWRFDSVGHSDYSYVFVKGEDREAAKIAMRESLVNLPNATMKGEFCAYRGSISPYEFWAESYPTVVYAP